MPAGSRGRGRLPDAEAPLWFQSLLERERLILLAGVAVVVAIAWTWLLSGGGIGPAEPTMVSMPQAGMESGTGKGMAGMGSTPMSEAVMDAMARTTWTTSYAAL